MPVLQVIPDQSQPVEQVCIYYSIDPDPQACYWRSTETKRSGAAWNATLPIMNARRPLFAFANIHCRLTTPEPVQFARPTPTCAISSLLHTVTPEALQKASVKVTDAPALLIDEFSNHWRDWYRLSADNPHHWQFWTRKISDPKWQGQPGYVLVSDVKCEKSNELVVVLTENFFRSYRGKQRDYVAVVKLQGTDGWQPMRLKTSDFKGVDGSGGLTSWQHCDLLGLRAYYRSRHATVMLGSVQWSGEKPRFRNLRWLPTVDKPGE